MNGSFFVHRANYNSVLDLARPMVLVRGFDSDESIYFKIRDKGSSLIQNIAFLSPNHNTFIRTFEGGYVVQTNDHDWGSAISGIDLIPHNPDNPELLELSGQMSISIEEYCEFHMCEAGDYWWPELNVYGNALICDNQSEKEWRSVLGCSHSGDLIETIDDIVLCPHCVVNEKTQIQGRPDPAGLIPLGWHSRYHSYTVRDFKSSNMVDVTYDDGGSDRFDYMEVIRHIMRQQERS